ncbi:uncharacterized protein LOC119996717 [Tripterygium wilfordii]|uniref:uncharacterized protein LOC119996717 n=1 Tax=Tripterygium wilfordii TaxID=458696 RepID=UPI0018F8405F|nr:uncharacterized protein LOC119996717 [Tripterygium wilfordii]
MSAGVLWSLIGRNEEERTMVSRGLLLFKAPSPKHLFFSPKFPFHRNIFNGVRSCSTTNTVSSLQLPTCIVWLKLPVPLSLRERSKNLRPKFGECWIGMDLFPFSQ